MVGVDCSVAATQSQTAQMADHLQVAIPGGEVQWSPIPQSLGTAGGRQCQNIGRESPLLEQVLDHRELPAPSRPVQRCRPTFVGHPQHSVWLCGQHSHIPTLCSLDGGGRSECSDDNAGSGSFVVDDDELLSPAPANVHGHAAPPSSSNVSSQ